MKKLDIVNKNRIVLNDLYFFRVDAITSGNKIRIYTVRDFEKYRELSAKGLKNLTENEATLLKAIVADNEEVQLSKGNYLVDSNTIFWKFSIDENSNLSGDAYYKDIEEQMVYELFFREGVAMRGTLSYKGRILSEFVNENDILCISYFNELGRLVSQTEVFTKLLNQENIVCKSFYPNGNVMRVENSIDQHITSYFENGVIESVQNLKGQWSKFYEESGLICSEMHCEDDKKIVVTYFDGVITEKMILSDEENTYYHFKEGMLNSYEVCNNATEEVISYAGDGRVLKSSAIAEIII